MPNDLSKIFPNLSSAIPDQKLFGTPGIGVNFKSISGINDIGGLTDPFAKWAGRTTAVCDFSDYIHPADSACAGYLSRLDTSVNPVVIAIKNMLCCADIMLVTSGGITLRSASLSDAYGSTRPSWAGPNTFRISLDFSKYSDSSVIDYVGAAFRHWGPFDPRTLSMSVFYMSILVHELTHVWCDMFGYAGDGELYPYMMQSFYYWYVYTHVMGGSYSFPAPTAYYFLNGLGSYDVATIKSRLFSFSGTTLPPWP